MMGIPDDREPDARSFGDDRIGQRSPGPADVP
jgi:hypothetical protein